jgi:hypothetical protein
VVGNALSAERNSGSGRERLSRFARRMTGILRIPIGIVETGRPVPQMAPMTHSDHTAVTLEGCLSKRALRLLAVGRLLQFQPRHGSFLATVLYHRKEKFEVITYKIKSRVLKDEGHKFETSDRASAVRKLRSLKKRDPQAKILEVGQR